MRHLHILRALLPGSGWFRSSCKVCVTPNFPCAGMGNSQQSKIPGCFYTPRLQINKSRSLFKM